MGSFVFSDAVAAETVRLATNELMIAKVFKRKFEREFNEGEPIGDTIRYRLPNQSTIREGFEYVGEQINQQYGSMTVDQKFGVDLETDVVEKALEMQRSTGMFPTSFTEYAGKKLAQEVEKRCAKFVALNTPMIIGAIGTTPTSFDTWMGAQSRIEEKGGFTGQKRAGLYMTPFDNRTLVSGTPNTIGLFHNDDHRDPTKVFRSGHVGEFAGYEIGRSMSLYSHTTGILADVTALTITSSGQSGNQLQIQATTGDTFKAGDHISAASMLDVNIMTKDPIVGQPKQFVIMQNATAVGGTVTLTIKPGIIGPGSPYQNVDSLPVAGDVVTFNPGTTMVNALAKTGKIAIAFTSEAFGISHVKVPRPKKSSFEESGEYTDEDTGLGIAFLGEFGFQNLGQRYRMDTWFGMGEFMGDTSSIAIGTGR